MSIDLRHLRYFTAVAQARAFGRAAEALGLTQPALSRQIADLEKQVGARLFRRTPKGVIATAAGDALLAGAERVLAAVQEALDAAQRSALGQGGRCTIAISRVVVSMRQLAQAITTLLRALPDADIDVKEVWVFKQALHLASGSIDIGLGHVTDAEHLSSEPYARLTFGAALVGVSHPLADRTELLPDDLADVPLCGPSPARDPYLVNLFRPALASAGIRSPQEFVYSSPSSIAMVVGAGRGWAFVPIGMRPFDSTRVIPVRGLRLDYPLHIVWRRTESRPVVLRVLEAMRRIRDSGPEVPSDDAGTRRRPAPAIPPHLELRHLRYFAAVADAGSVGRAAGRLGVSQPSLSRQMADLEHMIGAPLLRRTGRGVDLTDAGTVLRDQARVVFTTLDATLAVLKPARRALAGRCILGAVQTASAARVLGKVAALCERRWPRLRLTFEVYTTPNQPAALQQGLIDVGLCHAFPVADDHPDLASERILDDAIECALLPASHPLAGHASIDAAELADLPFLFMSRGYHGGFHGRMLEALRDLGLTPRIEGEYDEMSLCWTLAAEGKGWTTGFRSQRGHPPPGLAAVPIRGLFVPWGLDVLWRREEPNPAVADVVEALREVRESLAAPGRATVSGEFAAAARTPANKRPRARRSRSASR